MNVHAIPFMILLSVLCLSAAYLTVSAVLPQKYLVFLYGGEYLGAEGVVFQSKTNNCAPSSLKMILSRSGADVALAEIENYFRSAESDVTMRSLVSSVEMLGVSCSGWLLSPDDLSNDVLPAILLVHNNHCVVADSIDAERYLYLRDPAVGRLRIRPERLSSIWRGETLMINKQYEYRRVRQY